ncbi:MAG: ATP-binding cassette domain-containing protein [Deltaproteobacteria bacterium]|nr:ATP-binding cassette domain-containing protein [Deltaproteobacteria bacterium]MBW2224018.1 ATP-binding cassette domain-containing protein [Deltaproteobacteria bacterium]
MRVEGRAVRKRFGRVDALRGIDFTIPTGGRVGLIGPNASGKSTLIRIILRLLRSEGELLLDGEKERRMELADRIAYVPQIAPKFSASVGEVIRAITRVREMSPDTVVACGKDVGIDLLAVERQAFCNLSGGAKQKTLLSIALASQASLYVLDEPTASLDTQSRRDLFHLLSERTQDATLILCSHRLEEIRTLVDRVMVLEEGRLAYFGPTEDYLDRMTLSTIEVQMKNGVDDAVLARLGFQSGVAGWWSRTATRSEKLELVAQISHDLEGQIVNLLVRDADAVQLDEQGGGDDAHQDD